MSDRPENDGTFYLDNPPCPRCGLRIRVGEPVEGYVAASSKNDWDLKLRHATSTFTDCDGCIVALGSAVGALEERLAEHVHQDWGDGGGTIFP